MPTIRRFLVLATLLLVLRDSPAGPGRPAGRPPESVAALLTEGERLLDAGENQQAWDVYDRARANAQKQGDDRATIAALVGMGDADPPQADGKAAIAALTRALELARRTGAARPEAVRAHLEFRRGVHAARQGELAQSEPLFASALAAARKGSDARMEARSLNALGNIDLRQYEPAGAYKHFSVALRHAQALGYRPVQALAQRGLGDVARMQGQPLETLRRYEAALELQRACGNRRLAGTILIALGAMYVDQGNYAMAQRYNREALPLVKDDPEETSYALNNLGIVFAQVNGDLATDYFRKALRLAEEHEDHYGMMRVLNNLGDILRGKEDFARALELYSRALRLAEQEKDSQAMAGDWAGLALTYQMQGRHDLAARAYRKSLDLARELGEKSIVGQALGGLASLSLDRRDFPAAVELAGRAAATALEAGDRETFWKARTCAGTALRARGRYTAARQAFGEAIAMVEEVRGYAVGGQLGREAYLGARLAPYQGMVELAARQDDAVAALERAEQAKARSLIDTLRDGRGDLPSPLRPAELAAEQRLHDRLGALNGEILKARAEAARPAVLADLERRREAARLALEAFTLQLYATRSELRLRRTDFPAWSPADARALLAGGDTALLEFAVLADDVYLWTVTAASADSPIEVRVHRLPSGRNDLFRETEDFRRRLGDRNLDFQGSASRLYDLLLAPAASELRGKRSLLIVPDGPLWDLPFQVLQPSASEVLLDRHAVSYAPSLAFLAELARREARHPASPAPPTLLAFGNPELGKTAAPSVPLRGPASLGRLPDAESEVRDLARLYGAGRSAVFTASRASEARLKAEAGKFRVLHLATHALLEDRHPLYSALVLARDEGPKEEDGLLEAWEILGLRLDADLAVLSACQTARGRQSQGEGMIGLTWALAVAGSSATVASQWEVDSASTRRLMVELHRQWLAGASKAEALRRAALAVRRQERYRHPFYWGGFVLVGDDT